MVNKYCQKHKVRQEKEAPERYQNLSEGKKTKYNKIPKKIPKCYLRKKRIKVSGLSRIKAKATWVWKELLNDL